MALQGKSVISTAGTGITAGHCAQFGSSGMSVVDAGASCGTGAVSLSSTNTWTAWQTFNSSVTIIGTAGPNLLQISTATTGVALFSVSSSPAVNLNDYLLNVSSTSGTTAFGIQNNSHVVSSGTTPSVTSCGTGSPSVNGTDMGGQITTGGGSPTACTLTFSSPYANNPTCVCSPNAGVSCGVTSISTTAATFTLSLTETGINYICIGNKG